MHMSASSAFLVVSVLKIKTSPPHRFDVLSSLLSFSVGKKVVQLILGSSFIGLFPIKYLDLFRSNAMAVMTSLEKLVKCVWNKTIFFRQKAIFKEFAVLNTILKLRKSYFSGINTVPFPFERFPLLYYVFLNLNCYIITERNVYHTENLPERWAEHYCLSKGNLGIKSYYPFSLPSHTLQIETE